MPKTRKKTSYDQLYNQAPLTEPLDRFKISVQAVLMALDATNQFSKKQSAKLHRLSTDWKDIGSEIRSWQGYASHTAQELQKANNDSNASGGFIPNEQELKELRDNIEQAYKEYLEHDRELNQDDPNFQQLFTLTLPMYFIYLIAIWDAFILDTAKQILSVHPHLITTSNKIPEVSRAALWNCETLDEVRNCLLDAEMQRLDTDRNNLINTFKDYWGIDWQDSGIGLPLIAELRARRDIWVHNQGKVNRRYLEMLVKSNSQTLLKVGKTATIDVSYLETAIITLTILSVHIHSQAHLKHYSSKQ